MNSHFFSTRPGHPRPVAMRGDGVFLYDDTGKKYLDGSSGAMTANLGHGNPRVVDRINSQLSLLSFSYRSQFTNDPLELLSAKIAALAPGDLSSVAFANSGSEASELAMKLAHSYWKLMQRPEKQRVLSRWNSYHGSTIGALSMTGNPGRRREYAPYLSDYPVLELPFCHRCPYEKTYPDCSLFCARVLEKTIRRFGKDTISALIAEPVTGASGAGITPPSDYFPYIARVCKENDILLIMDEVITGFGRTGKNFASNHWNVVPDIIVFGKGITSGFGPLSGIIVSEQIRNAFIELDGEFSTGHTFSGNPLSAASANAVLDEIFDNGIIDNVAEKGSYLKRRLNELMQNYSVIDDVRGMGLLFGIEFSPDKGLTTTIVDLCFSEGLIVYPSSGFIDGIRGDSILISPPLTITIEEIDLLVDLLDAALSKLIV
ncbi:MAG: aspartate aminotransferase family protein [Firmicutes bacterium HGW-Firmicutes-11]|jgi:adenosylmethionine-8-amino-7-oxononanoate aminotransferase|nr:MAG: aspartate aminotransferase family protein [Firmicutes bacterium HGW-Firmicutes-11]